MPSAPAPAVIDPFANESHKTKSSNDIDQDKMAALEARIRVIEGVDLYDLVWQQKCVWFQMWLSRKSFVFLNLSNILEHNVP
jgi:hypothetical protein